MSALESVLLATKFRAPSLRHGVVDRPHLTALLDEGLRAGRALTLVSAPAGFGKTTAVSEWLLSGNAQAAWISLDDTENDPAQFVACLAHALDAIVPGLDDLVRALLGAHRMPGVPSLVTAIINQLAGQRSVAVLVLDDYHEIVEPSVHEAVQALLDHRPEQLHLVIISREDPPLALSRLRVRSEVTEVRAAQLRFSEGEIGDLLLHATGIALPSQQIHVLGERTEGWPAALQLAAFSLTDRLDSSAFVASFGGSNRFVIDFLTEEVLRRFDPDVRQFLLRTSVLTRLCDDLCGEVTDHPDPASVLDLLKRANLLVDLDAAGRWQRYHRVFADCLREQLSAEERNALHARAAAWFERAGDRSEAIRHLLAAGDESGASRLIDEAASDTLRVGAASTLLAWLDALPASQVAADRHLRTYRAWALALTGRVDEAATSVALDNLAIQDAAGDPIDGVRASLGAWIAMSSDRYVLAIDSGRRALELLPSKETVFRGGAHVAVAISQRALGQVGDALESYRDALRLLGPQSTLPAEGAIASTAILLREQCRAEDAVALCRQAISRLTLPSGEPAALAGFAESALGTILYDQNLLDEAESHLNAGEALCARLGLSHLLLGGRLVLARLLAARGDVEAGLAIAASVRERFSRAGAARDVSMADATSVDIRLLADDLRPARTWIASTDSLPWPEMDPSREFAYITRARALIACAEFDRAQALTARLLDSATANGRCRSAVTLCLLRAIALSEQGGGDECSELVRRALDLATPSRYLRLVLDAGLAVGPLLVRYVDSGSALAEQALAELGIRRAESPTGEGSDGLSERELAVLRLMEDGLTNKEIADALFLSLATVKWHANNAYGKLGVHSRTQALARARSLRLL